MKDITLLTHLQGLGQSAVQKPAAENLAGDFAAVLKDTVGKVNQAQIDADHQAERLHSGEAKNLHEVMITMEQADISMRLLVQMRNKVVDAYQEVMRMQV